MVALQIFVSNIIKMKREREITELGIKKVMQGIQRKMINKRNVKILTIEVKIHRGPLRPCILTLQFCMNGLTITIGQLGLF